MNHTADSWAESIYMREGLPVTLAEVPDEVQGKCIEYIRRTFGKATVPDDAKFNKVEKKEGGVSYISLQKLEDGQSVVLIAATTQHGLAVYEIDKKGGLDRDMFKS
ncbi:MAG: hypothetical protein JWM46_548 [Candidatus Kaiserbacteria bacterium]|nr:hypothetical protein [Candidatus Kaiserbacteria bacterium]